MLVQKERKNWKIIHNCPMVYIIMNQTTCLGDYKYYETDKLFFCKSTQKEHRGAKTVGSRSGGFSSGYRGQEFCRIFFPNQQFLLVFLGLFLIAGLILGVIFIRNADYSLLKTLDFVFFSNVKARSALPVLSIFVASLASSFLFLLFCFLCGLSIWGA